MPLQPLVPVLLLALLVSLGGMYGAALQASRGSLAWAAASFGFVAVAIGLVINVPLWRSTAPPGPLDTRDALRRTTRITMLVYTWGAAAMYVLYSVAGLRWQHGWQYGTGMALIAFGMLVYVRQLGNRDAWIASAAGIDAAVKLAAVQAIAAGGAIMWLVASGKVRTLRNDWAANIIFVTGGIAVICLSAIVVRSHVALTQRMALDPVDRADA
ncbi:MAG: hypothetical protein ACRCS9_04935 [Hyphomicrobium sp.]